MTIEYPRHDEAARAAIFEKEMEGAFRMGVTDIATMRRNIGGNMSYKAEDLRKAWSSRHPELHLRSLGWIKDGPEKVAEVAARWDDYDRAQQIQDRVRFRKDAREAIAGVRWCAYLLKRLAEPDVVARIQAGPQVEFVRWRKDRRYGRDDWTVINNRGEVVGEVIHVGPNAFKAVAYEAPFKAPGSIALYQNGSEEERPAHTEFKSVVKGQRKQARTALVTLLDLNAKTLFGKEISWP